MVGRSGQILALLLTCLIIGWGCQGRALPWMENHERKWIYVTAFSDDENVKFLALSLREIRQETNRHFIGGR